MSEAHGVHPDTEKQAILEDIAVRVRGYARHLAVLPFSDIQRTGVYRLPERAGIIQQPYLHATITAPVLDPPIEPQFGLALSDSPSGYPEDKVTSIHVSSEQRGAQDFRLFNRYWDDPWTSETTSRAMAAHILLALQRFDSLIPDLEPVPETANAIAWLNNRYGSWRG